MDCGKDAQIKVDFSFCPEDNGKSTLCGEAGKQDFGVKFPVKDFNGNGQATTRFWHSLMEIDEKDSFFGS